MRKHIFLDFDGTIVDSLNLAVNIYNDMAGRYNLNPLEHSDIAKLNKLSIPERIKLFNVPLYVLPKMAIEFKRRYKESIHLLKEFEGMRDVIMELKRIGYHLSIISSNSAINIQQFLANAKMECFDHIISSKALFGKQTIIKQTMRKLHLKRAEIMYIGDELRDIQSCKKAQVDMIAVTWGFDDAQLLSDGNPEYVARQPADILTILGEEKAE